MNDEEMPDSWGDDDWGVSGSNKGDDDGEDGWDMDMKTSDDAWDNNETTGRIL